MKERVQLRVDGGLLAWADEYARERRWTRTAVFEAALEALRGDAAGGVPDRPAATVAPAPSDARGIREQQREREPAPEGYEIPKIAPRRWVG